MKELLVKELLKLNFNNTEARVYICLIENGDKDLNGSQIAKILNISRASVYQGLDNLIERGAVYKLPKRTNIYKAEDPEMFMNKLKSSVTNATEKLRNEFKKMSTLKDETEIFIIEGDKPSLTKLKQIIKSAEVEIVLSTDMDLKPIEKELRAASMRGVRIIVFSFYDLPLYGINIEFFTYHWPLREDLPLNSTRMMLVADFKSCIIVGKQNNQEQFKGTFTENQLMVAVSSEHVHHDIYLIRIANAIDEDPFVLMGERLHSLWENRVI